MPTPGDYADRWQDEGLKGWEKIYELTTRSSYEALRPWFGGRGTAMELGCADGVNTERIARDFKKMVVIDFSPEFLETTRLRLGCQGLNNACFDYCSVVDYVPPRAATGRVDAIFAFNILEHLVDPVGVLKKYKEYLRPGGRFLIAVPNARSFHRQLGVAMGLFDDVTALNDQDRLLGHHRVYCMETLGADLEAAGLEYGEFQGNYMKPLSARQMNDWDPEILKGLEKMGKQFYGMAADLCVAAWEPTNDGGSQ